MVKCLQKGHKQKTNCEKNKNKQKKNGKKVLIYHLNKIPRFGSEAMLVEAESIRTMVEQQTFRGIRHMKSLPVRKKRTKRGYTQKRLGVTRARRYGYKCTRHIPKKK